MSVISPDAGGPDEAALAKIVGLSAEGYGDDAIVRKTGRTRHFVRKVLMGSARSIPALVQPDPRTAAEFAGRIHAAWQKTVWGYIEAGRWIVTAKDRLEHGEFLAMVDKSLPFGARTAQRLMVIAQDQRVVNAAHGSHLPSHWRTTYELTRLNDAEFDRRLADGTIRPDMERQDLTAAVKRERRAVQAARTFDGGTVENLHQLVASGLRAASILADPPWKFVTRSERGEGRSANQHYRTEGLEVIKRLPVDQLAADDAVLFMWMVDWCPAAAFEVMDAWGFTHKTTAFTWAKQNQGGEGWHMGQGYWTRANPEDCWLGVRGKPKRLHEDVRQLIVAPVMEHSRKPDEIYNRIERLVEGPYLELYARRERPGWVSWGDELPFTVPLPTHDPETGEIIEASATSPGAGLREISGTPVIGSKSSPECPTLPHDPETGEIIEAPAASVECAA